MFTHAAIELMGCVPAVNHEAVDGSGASRRRGQPFPSLHKTLCLCHNGICYNVIISV